MFDEQEFLSGSNEGVLDSKFNQLDAGEYKAQVMADPEKALKIDKGEKDGKPWAKLTVRLEIIDFTGEIKAKLGREPAISYGFFLDLDSNGKLDQSKQKNVRLGALLKATGNDRAGWRMTDICGKQLTIKVAKVKNDMNPEEPRSEVVMVGQAT